MGIQYGYARTSTTEQKAGFEAQIRELEARGCQRIFREQVSSVKERAELDALMAVMTEGDTLFVTKPDRLARSVKQFLEIIEDLDRRKIGLVILSMSGQLIDSRNPIGKLMLVVIGGIAEFERTMMLDRQRPGIAKAQAEGKYRRQQLGKSWRGSANRDPQELTDSVINARAKGHSYSEIAVLCSTNTRTAHRIVTAHKALENKGSLSAKAA